MRELLLCRGDTDAAERSLREGIALASRRGERSLELRAATSLARLLAARGAGEEARQALDGIYGWFTEGFDTADLVTARTTLLAELER